MSGIKFGTDGWRGVIADNFTFKNIKIASQAIADYLKKKHKNPKIIVGYDTRFLSREFAIVCSKVLLANKVRVYTTSEYTPTPTVSYAIVRNKFNGGVIITASHNPPIYNGLKFKGEYGGPAFPEITKAIEKRIERKPVNKNYMQAKVNWISPKKDYLKKITSYVNMRMLKKAKLKVAIDPMFGTGIGYLAKILSGTSCEVITIHNEVNPSFCGIRPEPIRENLSDLIKTVKKEKADCGFATDGDADRIGVVDEYGKFIDSQHLISLLLLHLVKNKNMKGGVVRTNSMTVALERIAKALNIKLFETPVGFKHIAKLMINEDIIIGGEESGGIGFKNYIPERDGILAALLTMEMMCIEGKSMSSLVKDMEKRFGRFRYNRVDTRIQDNKKEKLLKFLEKWEPVKVCGKQVVQKTDFDGIKFIFNDNSWLLFRASGTEPLIRIYAETNNDKDTNSLLNFGKSIISS